MSLTSSRCANGRRSGRKSAAPSCRFAVHHQSGRLGAEEVPDLERDARPAAEEIAAQAVQHWCGGSDGFGLIVPVLRNADKMSLFQIASELEPLAERARTGKASRDELTGSTFTISSLGKLGGAGDADHQLPEVAILGVHKIKETPAVRDGQIVVRQVMNLSISLDHRIVDGYEGAMFLQHVVSLLEDPTLMFMELT